MAVVVAVARPAVDVVAGAAFVAGVAARGRALARAAAIAAGHRARRTRHRTLAIRLAHRPVDDVAGVADLVVVGAAVDGAVVVDDGVAADDGGAVALVVRRPGHEHAADVGDAHAAAAHEHPRRVVDGVVAAPVAARRHRRPADVAAASAPADPGRRPRRARHPDPAEAGVVEPAAVVPGRPAERVVVDPRPAPLGVLPVAVRVRPEARADDGGGRHEHQSVAGVVDPAAVRRQRFNEVVGRGDAGVVFVAGRRLGGRCRLHDDALGGGRWRHRGGGRRRGGGRAGPVVDDVDGPGGAAGEARDAEGGGEDGGGQRRRMGAGHGFSWLLRRCPAPGDSTVWP